MPTADHVGVTVTHLATGQMVDLLVPEGWQDLRPAALGGAISRAGALGAPGRARPLVKAVEQPHEAVAVSGGERLPGDAPAMLTVARAPHARYAQQT